MAYTNFSAHTDQLAIAVLIKARSQQLGLTRAQLVRLAGYKNVAKGLRRLDELLSGDLESSKGLIKGLPAELEVPAAIVARALKKTQCEIREVKRREAEVSERAWRKAFKPHAYFATERTTP